MRRRAPIPLADSHHFHRGWPPILFYIILRMALSSRLSRFTCSSRMERVSSEALLAINLLNLAFAVTPGLLKVLGVKLYYSVYSIYYRMVKTIMIRDDIYNRLLSLKGDSSFSEVIARLLEESKTARVDRLRRYFGILKDEEAEELERIVEELRSRLRIRLP